jgi:hypothetical protein
MQYMPQERDDVTLHTMAADKPQACYISLGQGRAFNVNTRIFGVTRFGGLNANIRRF